MSNLDIEQEIQAKGLTRPRVTLEQIEQAIVSEHYFTAAQGEQQAQEDEGNGNASLAAASPLYRLTFCVLVLANGYTVTGESACVSTENFDCEIGQKIARQNAVDKCWPLFGFHLASTLYWQRSADVGSADVD